MSLITIKDCDVVDKGGRTLLKGLTLEIKDGECWFVTGGNSSGKKLFLDALTGALDIRTASMGSLYQNTFSTKNVEVVSLERAADLIREERERDESDYIEGGLDHGRTAKDYISEVLKSPCDVRTLPEVRLCGVESFLTRGLKYLSTGQVRRVCLARALSSGCSLLILMDVYSGLDTQSKDVISGFIDNILLRQRSGANTSFPYIIFCSARAVDAPKNITHVLEFSDKKITYKGPLAQYKSFLNSKENLGDIDKDKRREEFYKSIQEMAKKVRESLGYDYSEISNPLIEMKDVCVGWGDHRVLRHLNFKVDKGEHTLISGPNGSGKTTLLELITGDNGQVFSNDIMLFGKRRGPNLTIWDLKHLLGIVSYRLHVEYRMVGGVLGRDVVISGFRDSIGLYERATDLENQVSSDYLKAVGLGRLENVPFNNMSYGEQRALLIVRAAVKCPPLLILDEPCHALDDENRAMVLSLLDLIADMGGSTLLFVTHEESEILKCCHKRLRLSSEGDPMFFLETL